MTAAGTALGGGTAGRGPAGRGEAGRGSASSETGGAEEGPLAAAVFALLVLACFAAFFVTQRLKHTPTVVQRFERTPTFAPSSPLPQRREERISFKLAGADEVTVTIVDSSLSAVATLVRNYPVERYKQLSLRWNGRRGTARGYRVETSASGHRSVIPENAGALAPPGEYRVHVVMRRQGRDVYSPWAFTLEAR